MKKFSLLMSLYLIGCARGASGQPDEPPGSMGHQASVQQFSGEYFSLGNPSDGETLYETSAGESTLTEHGSSEHISGEHASGERASGEHATGEHTSGEHIASEHASGEQPSGEQPSDEKPSGEQLSGEQASGENISGEQSSSEKPSGEQVSAEKPSGEQASGEKASGPILNCHTCSYMNDHGKCLRGEGVCSTQNSQQCMLKKIFEGGKLQFMVQGCENMCPSMNLFSHGTRMQIICCRNQSFCNKI
ncbi:PREDICTED: acrosomal protein SP-10 isoform X3 [Odobenus rosmarus divergens]|uniref:Acrosomal protein SP-10 isoform X3 n=1 Tax=Odobenus rosmarus divergens TaxID=9708 RepID=A0A2U3X4N2_ODORO|nr:PREDICTED: acrosomal protein SP-10 isoform X3 [Odobenus rosmarus divergens]